MQKFFKQIINILDGVPAARGDRRKGQSLVELTFITPILLIMFVGLIEIGWFAQNYLNLIEAAKVGARRGPFMNGEFSPQQWFEPASLAPISQLDFTLSPGDPTYAIDPRITYRGLASGPQSCEDILPNEFGFFNTIACTVVDAMDPLRIRTTNRKDDIVISAFSVQYVNIGSDINPALSKFNSATEYEPGSQLVVVGRWPSTANECYQWGERDPFDWIENGRVDWEYVPNPRDPGNAEVRIRVNYELGVWNETAEPKRYDGWLDTGNEKAVGFSWTGQRRVENSAGLQLDCWGSGWRMEDVQRLVNLPHFIPDGSPNEEIRRSHLPSTGIVLVEVFWQHSFLLQDFPLLMSTWSPVYHVLGGGDPESTRDVIYAWAAFPVPSAEPRLVFRP